MIQTVYLLQKVRISFGEICVFLSIILYQTKKIRNQSDCCKNCNSHSRKLKQKREAITYLSYSTCKEHLHVQLLGRSRNKNPLYYWRSIGEYYIPARKCDALKSAALKSTANIDNNSETTKFFIINLLDTDTILPRTTLSIS